MRTDSYPEPRWQQLRHRHRHRFSITQEPHRRLRCRKFSDHLPTGAAGRKFMTEGNDSKRCNLHLWSFLGHSMKNRVSFSADRQPIAGILHIAAGEDVPTRCQQRTTDLEVRIRRIRFRSGDFGVFKEIVRGGHGWIKASEQRASVLPASSPLSLAAPLLYPPSGVRRECRSRACRSSV